MFGEFFSGSNLLVWPIVGLLIFLVTYLAVLAYAALATRRKGALDRVAALPLEDDEDESVEPTGPRTTAGGR